MEQHPLISLGNGKNVTDFLGREAMDIAHCQNQALGFRQQMDCIEENRHRFAG